MAEGLARTILPGRPEVSSAGIYRGEVHPLVVDAMRDIGIDLSSHRSRLLEEIEADSYDLVIVLAEPAFEATKTLKTKKRILLPYPDPTREPGAPEVIKERIRSVRDSLKKRIEGLMLKA